MDTVRADTPGVAFFLLGAGVGVWLAVVTRPTGEIIGSGLLVVGALLLTSRWFGFPIRALRQRGAEGPDPLAKAIADGHAIQLMTDVQNMGIEWDRWHSGVWEMLDRHFGLAEAQDFFDAAGIGSRPDRRRVPAYVAAQIEYLEGLRKCR
jgi:hypothetical protein